MNSLRTLVLPSFEALLHTSLHFQVWEAWTQRHIVKSLSESCRTENREHCITTAWNSWLLLSERKFFQNWREVYRRILLLLLLVTNPWYQSRGEHIVDNYPDWEHGGGWLQQAGLGISYCQSDLRLDYCHPFYVVPEVQNR